MLFPVFQRSVILCNVFFRRVFGWEEGWLGDTIHLFAERNSLRPPSNHMHFIHEFAMRLQQVHDVPGLFCCSFVDRHLASLMGILHVVAAYCFCVPTLFVDGRKHEEITQGNEGAERGVQLVGTAHGQLLENLLKNPTLSDLVGGIQSVTLGASSCVTLLRWRAICWETRHTAALRRYRCQSSGSCLF